MSDKLKIKQIDDMNKAELRQLKELSNECLSKRNSDKKIFLVSEMNLEDSIEAYKKWVEDFKLVRKREPTLEEKFKFVHKKDANREIRVELTSEELSIIQSDVWSAMIDLEEQNEFMKMKSKEIDITKRKALLKKLEDIL